MSGAPDMRYNLPVAAHVVTGIGVPKLRRIAAPLAVFLCAHGKSSYGRPCRGTFGCTGPQSGTPTLHGSPAPIGVGVSGAIRLLGAMS